MLEKVKNKLIEKGFSIEDITDAIAKVEKSFEENGLKFNPDGCKEGWLFLTLKTFIRFKSMDLKITFYEIK